MRPLIVVTAVPAAIAGVVAVGRALTRPPVRVVAGRQRRVVPGRGRHLHTALVALSSLLVAVGVGLAPGAAVAFGLGWVTPRWRRTRETNG